MQESKSAVIQVAVALMEARNVGMVTSEEWANLASAFEAESGVKIEWRTHDELLDIEDRAKPDA
jgi:hypothetical protein